MDISHSPYKLPLEICCKIIKYLPVSDAYSILTFIGFDLYKKKISDMLIDTFTVYKRIFFCADCDDDRYVCADSVYKNMIDICYVCGKRDVFRCLACRIYCRTCSTIVCPDCFLLTSMDIQPCPACK